MNANNVSNANSVGHGPTRRQVVVGLLLVMAVAAVIFFANLGQAQLWDRDEPRNAGCAVEMMQRNDWVVPVFNGELRYQKPVLLYWLMMGAYEVFGVNEFAARFWSALLGVGTVGITYLIALRLFGLQVAFLSGVILATNLMFAVAARAATPDSALIFFSTAVLAGFVWGSKTNSGSPQAVGGESEATLVRTFYDLPVAALLLMAVSMGLAMLTKGPVGFLMPMAIMGMTLLITRRKRSVSDIALSAGPLSAGPRVNGSRIGTLFQAIASTISPVHFVKTVIGMRPFLLLGIALVIAAPWYLWVGIATDFDFLRIFFIDEHIGRSTTAFESHSGGPWFYPLAILFGFFPWSLFWLPVAIVLYRIRSTWTDGTILMLCWVGVQVGLFSIAQTKLPSYVTPCYPALAILTAVGLLAWVDNRVSLARGWMVAVMVISIIVGVTIAAGAVSALESYYPGQYWLLSLGIPLGVPLVLGGCWALVKLRAEERPRALLGFSVGAVTFVFLLFGVAASSISEAQKNREILDHVSQLPPSVAVASYECLESTWPFYSHRTIYETGGDAKEQSIDRDRFWKPKPKTTPESFLEQTGNCVFITTLGRAEELVSRLPAGFAIRKTADYFLKNQKLVLIGR